MLWYVEFSKCKICGDELVWYMYANVEHNIIND
jgi:hypothetical protein